MSPEYGATCGFFPVDDVTLDYLRLTGRPPERIALVEAYCKENMLWHDPSEQPTYSQVVELDLGDVEPSLAGPRRPQDRVPLASAKEAFLEALGDVRRRPAQRLARQGGRGHLPGDATRRPSRQPGGAPEPEPDDAPVATAAAPGHKRTPVAGHRLRARPRLGRDRGDHLLHEHVEPAGDGRAPALLAKNAVERGLQRQPWVKSSLAPGSKVVTDYYEQAGPAGSTSTTLGFNTVGYGCTTCIGNSGPLPTRSRGAIGEGDLVVCSVLSGNRNFEARIHPEVKANYLASPPLVVAYALAGRMDVDLGDRAARHGSDGDDVYLRDIWPTRRRSATRSPAPCGPSCSRDTYADVFTGDEPVARPARAGRRALRLGAGLDLRTAAARTSTA